jgi:hypothetical protein
MKIRIIILFTFLICTNIFGQNTSTIPLADNAENLQSDSLHPVEIDKVLKDEPVKVKKFQMKKSPTKAILYSLLLPGLGQLYVESYWKAPLFLAGAGGLGYSIFYYNGLYNDYQGRYDALKRTSPNDFNLDLLNRQKEFYRDNRDISVFYLVIVYALSSVDAFSGAHLYDFNVSDDLSIGLKPDNKGDLRFALKYNW